jgi:hypothetical protein
MRDARELEDGVDHLAVRRRGEAERPSRRQPLDGRDGPRHER